MDTTDTAELARRAEWVAGLRGIADWFEQHPHRIPKHAAEETINLYMGGRDELAEIAREFGKAEKDADDSFFFVRKTFGPHRIDANVPRDVVCRKVVTGTRTVPTKVVPAHEEELVEWVCDDPILAGNSDHSRKVTALHEVTP